MFTSDSLSWQYVHLYAHHAWNKKPGSSCLGSADVHLWFHRMSFQTCSSLILGIIISTCQCERNWTLLVRFDVPGWACSIATGRSAFCVANQECHSVSIAFNVWLLRVVLGFVLTSDAFNLWMRGSEACLWHTKMVWIRKQSNEGKKQWSLPINPFTASV